MTSPEQKLVTEINRIRGKLRRPIVVALDGGSGAGKSTIAERLMRLTDVALVRLDDFYQTLIPESQLPRHTVEQRLNGVFDWARVRSEALEPLRAGRPGRWCAFDFMRGLGEGGTYSLKEQVTEVAPAPTILVDGAYSASPPLRDLIDLAVLVDAQHEARHLRAVARGTTPHSSAVASKSGMRLKLITLSVYARLNPLTSSLSMRRMPHDPWREERP